MTYENGEVSEPILVTIDVVPDAPGIEAEPDEDETRVGEPVTVNILENDGESDNPVVPDSVQIAGVPSNGEVVVNDDGTITYIPADGFSGTDTFTYTVTYENGEVSEPILVTIDVVPDGAPGIEAEPDEDETRVGEPVTVNILENDGESDNPVVPDSVQIAGVPSNGEVVVNDDGTITYIPADGFSDIDTFTYTVTYENGGGLRTDPRDY